MYKEDTLLLEFAPAVEAGLSGLVLFYNSVLVPVGNFAAAYGWPAVKFVVGKGIATPLIGAAAGAYIVGQEGILKLMDYCDSRSNSPEQKAKFKKFARMVRLKAKMVKKYGAANLLRNKVLKRYKINKVVKDNPKVPKEVVGGTTEGSVVMYQERILNEAQIKFLYCMCNHNPNIKQDSLYIEACIRNPKKMNNLIEGTGMDNTRARMLMFLAEAYGIRPIDSKRGKVLNFKRFKEEYKDVLKANSSKISARNLYSLYLLDSASNIYNLSELTKAALRHPLGALGAAYNNAAIKTAAFFGNPGMGGGEVIRAGLNAAKNIKQKVQNSNLWGRMRSYQGREKGDRSVNGAAEVALRKYGLERALQLFPTAKNYLMSLAKTTPVNQKVSGAVAESPAV